MSKFHLNLLVQISKAFVYSKIQILFGNNSPQLSAQPRLIPFFFQSATPPHGEAPPAMLPSPSLRARLTGGPHLSSLTSGPPELGRAATTSCPSPRRPAPPRMPPELLPPRHHFALLNPPLNLAPPSMALTPLTPPLLPPATPLRRSPRPL
jgi:hypothetical protein